MRIKNYRNIDWTYWFVFHILAWSIYAAAYLNAASYRDLPANYWIYITTTTLIASVICVFLKLIYDQIRSLSFWKKIIVSLVLCILASIIWNLLKNTMYNSMFEGFLPARESLELYRVTHLLNPLMLWSALYFLYDYHQLINEKKIQTLKAQSLANENKLKMLSYQLNPHFLFNVLNSIGSLVLKYDDMKLYNTITKLSDFLRYTLESQPWKMVTLKQELQCSNQYLEIQQIRFNDKITLEFDVQQDLLNIKLPSLILLPLIENVIKHTIAKSDQSVHLYCQIKLHQNQVKILIENSISNTQINDTNNLGIGINNVKERLFAYYKDQAQLDFDYDSNLFRAIMKLPLSTETLP